MASYGDFFWPSMVAGVVFLCSQKIVFACMFFLFFRIGWLVASFGNGFETCFKGRS